MKKITQKAVAKFMEGREFKSSNTSVEIWGNNVDMWLYYTRIAHKSGNTLTLNTGGYTTHTTKERLNGLLSEFGYFIRQSNWRWYLVNSLGVSVQFKDGMTINI